MTDVEVVRQTAVWRTTRDAEYALQHVPDGDPIQPGRSVVVAVTHFLPANAGVVLTVERADGAVDVVGRCEPADAGWALEHHLARTGGRLVVFPGSDLLVGTMTVADLLEVSAVDEVVGIGAQPVDPATPCDTQSFVRPTFDEGVVRLLVRPAAGGRVIPFEQPNPTPCCAEHP